MCRSSGVRSTTASLSPSCCAIVLAAVLTFTRWGYEVRFSGANPEAARYAGIPVRRRIIAVMLLSGAIAGVAGMLEVAGTVHRLQGGISNNFGYVGIMVAILARGSCLGVIAAAGADGRRSSMPASCCRPRGSPPTPCWR